MKLRIFILIFVSTMFVLTDATYRGHTQKQVTITLPYYPAQSKFSGSSSDTNFNVAENLLFFYCCSPQDGEKHSSIVRCTIENKPRSFNPPTVFGLATETCILNKEHNQVNPFFDSSINLMLLTPYKSSLVVTEKNPNVVCMLENILTDTYEKLEMTEPLRDVEGNISAGIIGLSWAVTNAEDFSQHDYIFAAVKDANGVWGDDNSGIAVIEFDKKEEEEIITKDAEGKEKTEKKIERFFNVLDANTGTSFGNKAVALNSTALSINGGKYSINPKKVDLFWDQQLRRLYIALQVKNSLDCSETQGSRALLVGRIDKEGKLVFDPILSDELCQGTDKIIGACGSGISTSLHKVCTMITSLGINYLVVVGGVGEPHETDKKVYALPLTDKLILQNYSQVIQDQLHGVIASKNSVIGDKFFATDQGGKVGGKLIVNAAANSNDVPTHYDRETQVGAGKELPSAITDLILVGDAVYVTCAQSGCGQQPGIFHSQAILTKNGKIAAWTPWQRIAGIQEGVAKAMISNAQYFLAYLKSDKPEVVCQITQDIPPNKERVEVEKVKGDLSDLIDSQFRRDKGGLQGLFDFPVTNPLCGNNNSVSLLVATGYKKIALIETGNDLNNQALFTGFKEGFTENIIDNTNGCIMPITAHTDVTKPYVLVVEGGVLDEIGGLSESVVVSDGLQAWLLIAGMRGVAILAADDGSGIACDSGLLPHFAGIQKPLTFRKLGKWKSIKKLSVDGQLLYVLTKNSLERIVITQDIVQNPALQKSSVIAQIPQKDGSFFDVGISGPLGLLATSKGLYVNAAGTDCRSESDVALEWRPIDLPGAKGAAYKLFFVSTTGQKNGFGHTGQVYVSTGSLLENMTRVYRLYVHDVFTKGVTNESVQLLEDMVYLRKGIMPLLSFANFRDLFATDGAHYFSARSRQMRERPFMKMISLSSIKSSRTSEPSSFDVPINIGKKTNNVSTFVQNSATGNWLLAGDFGLRIHN